MLWFPSVGFLKKIISQLRYISVYKPTCWTFRRWSITNSIDLCLSILNFLFNFIIYANFVRQHHNMVRVIFQTNSYKVVLTGRIDTARLQPKFPTPFFSNLILQRLTFSDEFSLSLTTIVYTVYRSKQKKVLEHRGAAQVSWLRWVDIFPFFFFKYSYYYIFKHTYKERE